MQLQVDGHEIDEPLNGELIEHAIFAMTNDSDSFVILSRDEMTYIQVAGGPRTGFLLEYQEGSLEKHFSCTELDLGTSDVIHAFQRYLVGDTRWKTDLAWTQGDPQAESSSTGMGKAIVFVIVAIAVLVAWQLLE